MSNLVYPCGVYSARVIQVIETKSARGSGGTEQPVRTVTEYWSLDGKKLAEHDPAAFVPESADGPCEPGESVECTTTYCGENEVITMPRDDRLLVGHASEDGLEGQ